MSALFRYQGRWIELWDRYRIPACPSFNSTRVLVRGFILHFGQARSGSRSGLEMEERSHDRRRSHPSRTDPESSRRITSKSVTAEDEQSQ